MLAEGRLIATLDEGDIALLEGLDGCVLELGANRIAPAEDITLHNIPTNLGDSEGRADRLAVSALIEELPNWKITNQTETSVHFELLSLSSR